MAPKSPGELRRNDAGRHLPPASTFVPLGELGGQVQGFRIDRLDIARRVHMQDKSSIENRRED